MLFLLVKILVTQHYYNYCLKEKNNLFSNLANMELVFFVIMFLTKTI
jgi:hypothetical protein